MAKRVMGKTAMLATMMAVLCAATPAQANNEIANFGPVFCPADETGHLQGKAARQISHSWPTLYPLTGPQLFTLDPETQPDVWLVLATEAAKDIDGIDVFAKSLTPEQLSTPSFPILSRGHDDDVAPRDRWLAQFPHYVRWYAWSKRFSFRVNWPANFGLRVTATVHTPRSMLAAGRTRWRANEHETDEHLRTADDDAEAPQWPCPHVYVHLRVEKDAVPIPPRQVREPTTTETGVRQRVYDALVDLSERYMGPLTNEPRAEEQPASYAVPVHLLLEPLYLGFLPHTALSLLAVLIPVLILAYVFIVPLVERIVADVMLEPAMLASDVDRPKTQ